MIHPAQRIVRAADKRSGRWLAIVAAGWLAAVGCQAHEPQKSSSTAASAWPQLFGPDRNGVSPDRGLAEAWPASGPPVVWQKEVGAGFSGPVVAGERLVLFHRLGDKEVVDCLDSVGGASKWRFEAITTYRDDFGFDPGPRSTPLIADGRVYALGAAGVLHCLELASGKEIWNRALSVDYRAPKGFFGVATSPLLEEGRLWINVGGPGAGIVALAADTGKEVWKATDHAASYSSPMAATIDGERHIFFFTREGFVDIDPKNLKVRTTKHWRSRMDASVNAATPIVVGNEVFLSSSYGTGALLLRVSKNGCEEVWKGDGILSNHYATSVYHDGHLYGFDGRQEQRARLRCVEFATGKVSWSQEGFGCGWIIAADGKLIILGEQGELFLVEATPEAYREKARTSVFTRTCRAPIALASGRLYARDTGKLVCLDLRK